jgi:UDP-N-acetylmuramoyl-tripeptide--D-alanyl-D-alanine ligase
MDMKITDYFYELFLDCSGISTDTRNIKKNSLFVCLRGANFNGNDYALLAIEKGAKYVISDDSRWNGVDGIHIVEDSLLFLQSLATYHRRQFNIPVIGITGSNGKTTTKELMAAVLSEKFEVLYTQGNLNNHIGVPLTLLQLNQSHELAIIEMGANRLHDIKELCAIAEPTHGIITNIGRAHLEGFGSLEGVICTKKELYDSIELNGGTIVYNADDVILQGNLPKVDKLFCYSSHNSEADIHGQLEGENEYMAFRWSYEHYQSPLIQTQLTGSYNLSNFLAAVSFGVLLGVQSEQINEALASYSPSNQRSQITQTERNKLILDCYNANPTSVKNALLSFSTFPAEHKLVIIGDMLELGSDSLSEHQQVISLLKELELSAVLVGKEFNKGIPNESVVKIFTSVQQLIESGIKEKYTGYTILIKGSRGIQLERLIPYL